MNRVELRNIIRQEIKIAMGELPDWDKYNNGHPGAKKKRNRMSTQPKLRSTWTVLPEEMLTEGYTLSWEHLEDFDNKEWSKIIKATVATIKLAKSKGIEIAGPHGTGQPKLDKDKIALNGSSEQKSDGDTAEHESFVLSRERHKFGGGSWSFVKTARKPYDAVVATILAAAHKVAPKKFKPGGDGGPMGVRPGGLGKWKWLPDSVDE